MKRENFTPSTGTVDNFFAELCMHEIENSRVSIVCSVQVLPKTPWIYVRRENCTPSTVTVRNSLEEICRHELENKGWKELFPGYDDRRDVIFTLVTNNVLLS